MDVLRGVLLRVKQGETIFKPDDDSIEALRAFQPIAQALIVARDRKLIASVHMRQPSKGNDTYGLIPFGSVTGGLTYDGEQYLSLWSRLFRAAVQHLGKIISLVIAGVLVAVILHRLRIG